jgi:hypothetical protein
MIMCKRLAVRTILLACLLLQGCVGVMFPGARTETVREPVVGEKSHYGVYRAYRQPRTTTVSLTERWGEPASVATLPSTGDELWTYEFGTVWYGIIPCVVLPVPLALPLGREKVILRVRDREVISADVITCDFVGGACASLVGPDGPWAGAGWRKRSPWL